MKYIERYDVQTKWIEENRGKPLDEVFVKEEVQEKSRKGKHASNEKDKLLK